MKGTSLIGVALLAPIKRDEHRQGKGAIGVRQLDKDRQHGPLVPVSKDGMRVGAAYRVAMPGFAVDFLAAMTVNRFVPADLDRSVGNKPIKDKFRNPIRQWSRLPAAVREQTMVSRRIDHLDQAQQSEYIGNSSVTSC